MRSGSRLSSFNPGSAHADILDVLAVSSEMAPFAAHPDYQYSLDYMDKELKAVGEVANRLGVRLTTHPGAHDPSHRRRR